MYTEINNRLDARSLRAGSFVRVLVGRYSDCVMMLYQCRTVTGDGMRVGKENTHMACKQSIPNSNERWGNFEGGEGRKGWEGFLAVHGRAGRYFNHLVSIIHVCQGACAARIESSAQQREMGCKTCSSFTGDVREPRNSPFYRRTKSDNTQPIQPLAAFVALLCPPVRCGRWAKGRSWRERENHFTHMYQAPCSPSRRYLLVRLHKQGQGGEG